MTKAVEANMYHFIDEVFGNDNTTGKLLCLFVCLSVCLSGTAFAFHNANHFTSIFFKFSVKHVFYFLVGSLSIIIYSYNENHVQIMCRDIHNPLQYIGI